MSGFETAVAFVLKWEGDISDDPHDPGRLTRFGISQRAYPSLDIKNLTVEDAKGLYKRDYWDRCGCDLLPSAIALMLFDAAVNQGPSQAIRLLQRSLKVKEDGAIGPETIKAANTQGQRAVSELVAWRALAYAANPLVSRDGPGWFRRLAACHQAALQA